MSSKKAFSPRPFNVVLAALLLAACAGPFARSRFHPAAGRGPSDPPLKIHFRLPLERARILSPFGTRHGRLHTGIDLLETRGGGDPVLAAADGRVVGIGRGGSYGRSVLLEHAGGYRTRYAHLRKSLARPNAHVAAGEKIGIVGRTGNATTAHLHFEVITPSGRFLDPGPLLFPPSPRPAGKSKK